ncbi:integrase arm-type DNA-binding domain-containing protein [Malonomonas rubra]|uniref:tyrosine-type recombinase/integrase n=1 Tax=Malonomonas rubra TaxID=57040 RepID=UPI0026EE264B|nr:integrase arm-type DNA-binding domain-containing protein [Malonomonas rubra]
MPKRTLPLSDTQVKNSKPKEKNYKLADGGGMYLLVTASGGKLWRLDYRFKDKRKTLAMGSYPEITLGEARQRRHEARQLLANNVDPGELKKTIKVEEMDERNNTFEKLARDWLDRQTTELAATTQKMIRSRLDKDIYPTIGDTPLTELSAQLILEKVLRPIEARGAIESAHRVRGTISQILRYGVACGVCDRDLTADMRGALKPIPRKHHAALDSTGGTTDPLKVGELLRTIDTYDGSLVVKHALQLHPYIATRPGELRHAEWGEIDFDTATWSIPAGRMKMKNPHVVPLSPQAVDILQSLLKLTGTGKYLFPSVRSVARPISDNTMNAALRRLGYSKDEIVSHGWRAIFRTLADEVLQERVDIIEAQLAHQVNDVLGRAYNRTSFLAERRELMNRWGKYLNWLKEKKKKPSDTHSIFSEIRSHRIQ